MARKKAKKQKVAAKKSNLSDRKTRLAASELSARDQARINCKHVLDALHAETSGWGGAAAEARVKAFCNDPINASAAEFAFVGSLILQRWYIDPAKPEGNERLSLWMEIRTRMQRRVTEVPGGWNGQSDVFLVQSIAEETP